MHPIETLWWTHCITRLILAALTWDEVVEYEVNIHMRWVVDEELVGGADSVTCLLL